MRKLAFISIFFAMDLWGMCRFPHNPGVYCIKANVNNLKKYSQSKTYQCAGDLDLKTIYRPRGTYYYDQKLNLHNFNENEKISINEFKSKKKIFAKNCDEFKSKEFLIELSCYDTNSEFEDYSFLVNGKLKNKIYDPWNQKEVIIDCTFLKEHK